MNESEEPEPRPPPRTAAETVGGETLLDVIPDGIGLNRLRSGAPSLGVTAF